MKSWISWILFWLVVAPLAMGAPEVITRYVDRDNGDNSNDGTTPETAWATMVYAESQFSTYGEHGDGDFTATGTTYPEGIIGELWCAGSTADTLAVTWDIVTSSTNYMRITGDGTYTHNIANALTNLTLNTDCIEFVDIHFAMSTTSADDRRIVYVASVNAGGWQRFRGCTFTGPDDGTYRTRLVYAADSDACVELNNCKIVDAGSVSGSYGVYAYAGTAYAYNCTIDNCYNGIRVRDTTTAKAYGKNTLVAGSAGNAYEKGTSGTLQLWNCTADDGTASLYDQGSDCHDNVTPTFTGDYQLAETDTIWIDGGMDLSADSHWHDDDVDAWDTLRPQGSAWDIGWHERLQDTGPPPPGPRRPVIQLKMFFPPFIFGN